jgi:aldehyde:ferredoxin oxidoreductase
VKGFFNRFLRLDLSTGSWSAEEISDDVLRTYLGGKGLASFLMLNLAPPNVAPLAPENPFILVVGPATGSVLAPASRYGVFAKSPLTGIWGEAYAGGFVAPAIKGTGYDAIVIQGASDRPVWLEIDEHGVNINDAHEFWGLDAYAAEEALSKATNLQRGRPIVIGPAGENQVRFAVVSNDRGHQAGRTGLGAVLGAKRVKGVVFGGKARCELYDAEGVKAYNDDLRRKGKADPATARYREIGTSMSVSLLNQAGAFPSYYWSAGTVPHWAQISGEALVENFAPRPRACQRCFMACGKVTTVPQGRHKGLVVEGPEYETIYAFGGLCGVQDLSEIIYLNDLCDRWGIDTITGGNVAAFAIEASRRGVLDIDLEYNDVDGIAQLLVKTAKRDGVGDLLSRGVRAASRELGLEDLAIHVKGLEPAGFDPRALKGMGLAYAVSERGACHLRATVYKAELSGKADPSSVSGKANLVRDFADQHTLFDTLIFCRFYRDLIGWGDLSRIVHALTGMEASRENLEALAARVTDAIRQYNLREGMTPADDMLPDRFFREPLLPTNRTLSQEEVRRMVDEYYTLRGWGSGAEGEPCST